MSINEEKQFSDMVLLLRVPVVGLIIKLYHSGIHSFCVEASLPMTLAISATGRTAMYFGGVPSAHGSWYLLPTFLSATLPLLTS